VQICRALFRLGKTDELVDVDIDRISADAQRAIESAKTIVTQLLTFDRLALTAARKRFTGVCYFLNVFKNPRGVSRSPFNFAFLFTCIINI
jgi:hypothetical protein